MEETLGQRVRRLRQERGLTLDGLAEKAGVTKTHVYQIEHGIRTRMRLSTLARYARALGVSQGYLEWGTTDQPEDGRQALREVLQRTTSLSDEEIERVVQFVEMLVEERPQGEGEVG